MMGKTDIIIFSGTTEGHKLSEMLSYNGIEHIVCVASEYGMSVMDESQYADIRVGRLDADEMRTMFLEEANSKTVIVDATHPYAGVVTENILRVSKELNLQYIRIIRDRSDMKGIVYENMEELREALESIVGNSEDKVLLTTGSKDIPILCRNLNAQQKKKLYVRVLPSIESINICLENGIEQGHIIAMQGPFTKEMNSALLRQYNIRHMLTKESGINGGFDEKIAASEECKVVCHIVARKEEEGLHVEEAIKCLVNEKAQKECTRNMEVILIGRGMGNWNNLTGEAILAIEKADAVFGAKRLIADINSSKKYEMYKAEDIIPVLQKNKDIKTAVILLSGDSGFYSGARLLKEKIDKIAETRLICGISSVSYLSAKIGESYEDAFICSIHGRNEIANIKSAVNGIIRNKKNFVLLSGALDVRALAKELNSNLCEMEGITPEEIADGIRICIGTNLSYKDESIESLTINEAQEFDKDGVMTGFIRNSLNRRAPLVNVLRDNQLIRDKIPMTKESVRHLSILELGIKQGDVVYDIGGGTGSVAIEISKLDPNIQVYTIEKNMDAVQLIYKNIEKLNVSNVTVIEGNAPEVLSDLEPCDAVFIGGSQGQLADILAAIQNKNKETRVVINAVSIETICEVNSILKTINAKDVRALQLSATNIKEIGDYHMMQANNPVMIYSFTLYQER